MRATSRSEPDADLLGNRQDVPPPDSPSLAPKRRVARGEFRLAAILSIVVGTLLLLEEFDVLEGVHRLWPIFPALLGFGFLLLFRSRMRSDLALLGMGTYLLAVSVLFFVCTFTSWSILAHTWPIFVAILGGSSIITSIFARRTRTILLASGLFLLLIASVLLLVIEVDAGLWPLALVLFGVWVLAISSFRKRQLTRSTRR